MFFKKLKSWPFNVFLIFLVWRLFLFGVSALAIHFIPFKASFPYSDIFLRNSGLAESIWVFGNFDGVHYLGIAQQGYYGFGLQVFFPLYPILIKLVSTLMANYLLAGLLVSHAAILGASLLLYRFVEGKYNTQAAIWTTLFLYFFPTSFFFGSVYTESLFLLLVLISFLGRGKMAILGGIMACATRLTGLALVPALFKKHPIGSLLVFVGFLSYLFYLYHAFGNPWLFFSAQSAFHNARAVSFTTLVTPFQVVFRYLKIFTSVSPSALDFWIALLEFCSFIFGLGMLLYLTLKRTFPGSFLIFSWICLLLPTFSGTFSSMPRYLLPIFPIYIALATSPRTIFRLGILSLSILLLALLTGLFTRGYFVS